MKSREDIDKLLQDNIQFLSPNEPISVQGVGRVLSQLASATEDLEEAVSGLSGKSITLWNPNIVYAKDDIVLHFKTEEKQVSPEVGKREFAFILVSTKEVNTSIPNYNMVDGTPDFRKSNWKLVNPTSYLLQDIVGMREIVEGAFREVLDGHVKDDHGLAVSLDIKDNLLRRDYSNLRTPWETGKYSLNILDTPTLKKSSNGVMELSIRYAFDQKANQGVLIGDRRHYYRKSPIWDDSDHTIFASKYREDGTLFSVVLNNPNKHVAFNNLRYGTNIFNARIEFPEPFVNDEYMVFFDTTPPGAFVFGYERGDLMQKDGPTWDAVVSMPMLLNKSDSGFDVVLPIHAHFNSMQKYNIGVPWDNEFRLQVIGRYR